ncbi:MAG TPA: hypothetical protein VGB66_12845, partial [Longimicrobium sp.]
MQTRVVLALPVLAGLMAACAPRTDAPDTAPAETRPGAGTPATQPPVAQSADCTPLETRPANTPSNQPAFAGQTRVCGVRSTVAFDVAVVARGLQKPWSVEPLP